MRIGFNDTKDADPVDTRRRHRVILPVYIPRLEGYFAHSLEVLRLCVASLAATGGRHVSITLVANQCCHEALEVLTSYFRSGVIDQLVTNRQNLGRVDSMLSAARASFEDLITVSDSDVLFTTGWMQAIESLFCAFPECAVATIVPHPGAAWDNTSSTVLSAWRRRELGFDKVVPDRDIDRHGASIGRPDYVKPAQRAAQVIVRRNGATACVGAQHFLLSIRRAALACFPPDPSLRPLGSMSDEFWIDRPPDVAGYWRLATPRSYAYHMGNVPEPWMYDELERAEGVPADSTKPALALPALVRPVEARIPWRSRRVMARALQKTWLDRRFARCANRRLPDLGRAPAIGVK